MPLVWGSDDEDDEIGEAGRMSLDELCTAYGQFGIVAMLYFLGDVCEQLAVASRALQGDLTDVGEVLSNMQGLVGSLENDYPATGPISWGPRMRKFITRAGSSLLTSAPTDIKLSSGTAKEGDSGTRMSELLSTPDRLMSAKTTTGEELSSR